MAEIFISMPVYNGAPYLRTALESLLNQTFTDFEIFISDNASTDDTQNIISEFSNKDPRITCERLEFTVPSQVNFINALNKVNSQFFMLAAHDDYHEPLFIENVMKELKKNVGVVGAFCGCKTENYITKNVSENLTPRMNSNNSYYSNLCKYITAPVPSTIYGIYRYDALDIIKWCFQNPFDWSDVCTMYRIFSKGNFSFCEDVLFTAGITSRERDPKPYKMKKGLIDTHYQYGNFFYYGIKAILQTGSFSFFEKISLIKKHINLVSRCFLSQEPQSPRIIRCVVKLIKIITK